MSEKRTARADGVCSECLSKPAITNDGLFCLTCLKQIVRDELTPSEGRSLSRRGTEQTGRPSRSPTVVAEQGEYDVGIDGEACEVASPKQVGEVR